MLISSKVKIVSIVDPKSAEILNTSFSDPIKSWRSQSLKGLTPLLKKYQTPDTESNFQI